MTYDGSIKFDTKIDTKGLKNGLSGLGSVAKTAAKGVVTAVGAAAVAVGGLIGKSVTAFADYEQLVGGVETLLGAGGKSLEEYAQNVGKSVAEAKESYDKLMASQETVLKNASIAYKTAGLSANDYMETITGFSASLLQGLEGDTQKAADYANVAVMDMSDNANKMGTSMKAIQYAYQGFAKQNYTMLDNLKLGYGGAKTEMERLLADAQKLTGQKFDISSFADVVQAIHVIQEEMGITGTTAQEAEHTISGSAASMKAAWNNALVSLTKGGDDFDESMANLVSTVKTFGGNVIPAVMRALSGIGDMISGLAPSLAIAITELANIAPEIAVAATSLVEALIEGIEQNLPQIVDSGMEALIALTEGILAMLPQLIELGMNIIAQLALGLAEAIPELIPTAIDAVMAIVDTLLDNIDMLIDAAIALMMALADGIIEAVPKIVEKIPVVIEKLIQALIRNYPKMAIAGYNLIGKFFEAIWTVFKSCYSTMGQYVYNYVIKPIADKVTDFFNVGKNLIEGLWKGISNAAGWLLGKIKEFCGNVLNGIKGFFGIASPSRVMRDEVGAMMVKGLANGIDENTYVALASLDKLNDKMLAAEEKYIAEEKRIKDARDEQDEAKRLKEYQKRLANAKDAAEAEEIKQEEILRLQKRADDKYLEELKATAEKSKQIYNEQKKYIEELKQTIIDGYTDIVTAAGKEIDEVLSLQKKMSDKMKSYGALYETHTITIKGAGEYGQDLVNSHVVLRDLTKDIEELTAYNEAINAVGDIIRGRDMSPELQREFMDALRDMSVADGTEFAQALLNAGENELDTYLTAWRDKQELISEASKDLYAEETEKMIAFITKELEEAGKVVPEGFFDTGKDAAENFGKGFMDKIGEVMKKVEAAVAVSTANMFPSLSFAGALPAVASVSTVYNSPTYQLLPNNEGTRAQIEAISNAETVKRLRGW